MSGQWTPVQFWPVPKRARWDRESIARRRPVAGTVEVDVTPKWWVPRGESEFDIARGTVREFFFRWYSEKNRFGEGLRMLYRHVPGDAFSVHTDSIVVLTTYDHVDAARSLCAALLDRLSGPDVRRRTDGRIALILGDGVWSHFESRHYRVRIKSRPDVDEVMAQWSYERAVYDSKSSVLRHFGMDPVM